VDIIDSYLAYQLTQSAELPADDGAWFSSLARSEADYDRKLAAACSQLDPVQIAAWVTRQAARGDPVSQFLLSRDIGVEIGRSSNIIMYKTPDRAVSNQWLRKAADAGFAQAKFELAWDILNTRQPRITPASYSALSLDREAAESLPLAEASLALCEYSGCEGTAPDIAAAVTHAHDAAIRGQAEAFLEIGPHLGAAQADELAAWKLIHPSLQQRGCSVSSVSIKWMKSITEDLSAANAFPGGLKLATEIWEGHGRQMMSALGCAP
jgi:TPR repeat protein